MPEPSDTTERPHERSRERDRSQPQPGRCPTHPSAVAISLCAVCGRGLCVACAIPVRGQVIGPECVPVVVEDLPAQPDPPSPRRPRGDLVALAGFALVVAVSFFPWSRFGVASGLADAWTVHWSLVAVVSALAGGAAAIAVRRRHLDLRVAAGLYAVFAAGVVVGALLHATRPPPLSNAAVTLPWRVAIAGAAMALAGAASNLLAADRISRGR